MRIIFAGTPEFSVPILRALIENKADIIAVYTQPDRVSGRGQHLQMSPVKQCALKYNLPVEQPLSFKTVEVQEHFAALKPDLFIVVAYGLILPQVVLDIPKYGCLNIHASLLPRWRGASPIQQAILAGDSETGVCIMKMEAGLDTGPVYLRKTCAILAKDNAQSLHDKLAILGAEALLEVISDTHDIYKSQPEEQSTDNTHITYASKITKQMGLIDWNKSAIEINRQVKAYNPWPVAYCYHQEEYIRVWEGEALSDSQTDALPGTWVHVSADGIDIATGDKTLFRITQLQCANAKKMSVREYCNKL